MLAWPTWIGSTVLMDDETKLALRAVIEACDRFGLDDARHYLTQDQVRAAAEENPGEVSGWIHTFLDGWTLVDGDDAEREVDHVRIELQEKSNRIVRDFGLTRSAASETIYGGIALERQHFDLVDWGYRVLRPNLQAVVRPMSIKNASLVPELQVPKESSLERDKIFRRYGKIVRKEDDPNVSTAVLCQIITKPTLRSRLDRSPIRAHVYEAIATFLGGSVTLPSTQVAAWCRVLEKIADFNGTQLPAAFHAFAQETWEFYSRLLGLVPTVNLNDDPTHKPQYQLWSEEVASLVFPNLNGSDWETAIRTRGVGPGLDYLSRPEIAALRWAMLPWTRSTQSSFGGTAGGTINFVPTSRS